MLEFADGFLNLMTISEMVRHRRLVVPQVVNARPRRGESARALRGLRAVLLAALLAAEGVRVRMGPCAPMGGCHLCHLCHVYQMKIKISS